MDVTKSTIKPEDVPRKPATKRFTRRIGIAVTEEMYQALMYLRREMSMDICELTRMQWDDFLSRVDVKDAG